MAGKTGIVGPVESGRAAGCTKDGFGPDFIGRTGQDVEAQGTGNTIVADDVVGDIQVIDNFDVVQFLYGIG